MAFFCIIGGIIVSKIGVRPSLLVRTIPLGRSRSLPNSPQIASTGDIMLVRLASVFGSVVLMSTSAIAMPAVSI